MLNVNKRYSKTAVRGILMAKKNMTKSGRPGKVSRRGNPDTGKIVALIVLIALGLGFLGSSLWYNLYHQPKAEAAIEAAAASFTQEFFTVGYETITGSEGSSWMTERLARDVAASDRVASWKDREISAQVEGDIEVRINRHGLRNGQARVIFWQRETADGKESRFLQYYDYDFLYQGGQWLIDRVNVPTEEGLKDLRKARGVWDQHYGDEEDDDEDEDDEETEPAE